MNGSDESFLVLRGEVGREHGFQSLKVSVKVLEPFLYGTCCLCARLGGVGRVRSRRIGRLARNTSRDDVLCVVGRGFERLTRRKCGRRARWETNLCRTLHVVHHTIGVPVGTRMAEILYRHVFHGSRVKKKERRRHLMARKRDMRCLLMLRRRERPGDARRRFGDLDFLRRPGERFSRPRRGDWSRGCAPKLTMPVRKTSSASIPWRVRCQRTKIITTLAAIAITTPILERVQTSNGYARSIGSCVYHLSLPK